MKKLIITLLILFPCITLGYTFNRSLKVNMQGSDVLELQKILKQEFPDYKNEWMTGYFGNITKSYVIKLQERYATQILHPYNLYKGTGFVGNSTIAFLNNQTQESLDIQCISSKDKVSIGDSVVFYILKNTGSDPFTHYWNNVPGDFFKQVTINSASDTQIPVTVIDANQNQATVVCSVSLDTIKYSTVDKVVEIEEIDKQNTKAVVKENTPLILSCDSDEFKYLEYYRDKIFIPENSFLGKIYKSCKSMSYFEADPVLLKSFISYVKINTNFVLDSTEVVESSDKINLSLVSITPCRMYVMDNDSFINNRSYKYNFVAPTCTDDAGFFSNGVEEVSCEEALKYRAKSVNHYYYVFRLCVKNNGKEEVGPISFSYLDYNNKGLQWKFVDSMEDIIYVNEHETVSVKHTINKCYEDMYLSSKGLGFMLNTKYNWIDKIKPNDAECVNLILVQDGEPLLSGDFQDYRGIIRPRRVYTATSLYSFNNCQEDLKGEILYNLGFSSDKLSTNDLYQSKYIKSGISLPSSSKFLCVVGNSNILPDYKEDSKLKPQHPKLRPCWVKGHSDSIKRWLNSLLSEHIANSIGDDSDISASELREEYYENVYPRYYDTCVIEYQFTCVRDFFSKTECEKDGFEIFDEMTAEEYEEIIQTQGK